MNYDFPVDITLENLLRAIDGDKSFVVAKKDDLVFVNYVVASPDTFPAVSDERDAIRRECRGIVFRDGKVVSRPYHKFFNLNEREETQTHAIDFSKGHVVLDKLDGSMIRPIEIDGQLVPATKMGYTDVARQCHDFIKDRKNIMEMFSELYRDGYTPIFEYVSPDNRIVVRYDRSDLVLTAIRDNVTGKYLGVGDLKTIASRYDVSVVRAFDSDGDTRTFVERVRNDTSFDEGVVVRFTDGHMVKIKTEEYVSIHNAKDALRFYNKIVMLHLDGLLDDVIALLDEDDRKDVENHVRDFDEWFGTMSNKLEDVSGESLERYSNKRDFAINMSGSLPSFQRCFVFKVFDGKGASAKDYILEAVRKNKGKWKDIAGE